jgi:hypothetical protein
MMLKRWYWYVGTIISFIGVVLKTCVVPQLPPDPPSLRITVAMVGITLGLSGLVVICWGTKRRLDRQARESARNN